MSQTNRRTFLTTAARWGAMLGLGSLFARVLGGRSEAPDSAGSGPPCRRCAVLAQCNRPDGVKARDAAAIAPSPRPAPGDSRGLCGEPPDGELVSRWVRRDEA